MSSVKHLLIATFILTALVACAPGNPPGNTPAPLPTNTPAAAPTVLPTPTSPLGGILTPAGARVPAFSHIYLVVMENKEYNEIVSNSDAHYINDLIEHYGLATNYMAVTHPSQPNYFALFSGSTQGIKDDKQHTVDATNLVDQLEGRGKTWKIYEQNIPNGCYTGMSASGGSDGGGEYLRRHNPAISFTDISSNSGRCANIVNFTRFNPAAADFEMIVANSCNDMHDCTTSDGDHFLEQFVPQIINSDAWKKDGLLMITWDEGTTSKAGGGHVPAIVISSRVPAGFQSSTPHDHYSLLRTIQDAWGLGCLEQTCSANNFGEFFH